MSIAIQRWCKLPVEQEDGYLPFGEKSNMVFSSKDFWKIKNGMG